METLSLTAHLEIFQNNHVTMYSKACLKRPLKNRQNIDLNDK